MTYKESIIHRLPQLIANKERKKEASVQNVFETLLNTEKFCDVHNIIKIICDLNWMYFIIISFAKTSNSNATHKEDNEFYH